MKKDDKEPCMQGQKAVLTGKMLEGMIESALFNNGYEKMDNLGVANSLLNLEVKKKWFCRQYNRAKGIYDVPVRIDFLVVFPEKYPSGLAIEVKFQRTPGSVDEKYPFVVLNMRRLFEYYGIKSVIFMEGGGYRECVLRWCLEQKSDYLEVVEGMGNIFNWIIENLT